MISYNDIYEALRKERYSEQLQPLPKKFINEVSEYIRERKASTSEANIDKSSLFVDDAIKMKKQLENAISIFNELMLLRKKKLLSLAFVASETGINKRDFDNMVEFEKEMFDKIIIALNESAKSLSNELNDQSIVTGKEVKLVLFLEDIDELVGMDGKVIGPYKKDEITLLAKEIADILIGDKKAEVIMDE